MSQKQFQSTTQKFLDIYDITNNLVILKDGTVSFVLTISAMNFGLLAEAEQDAIIYTYAALLNSLNYPIQIIIQSQTKDATSYLNLLKQQESKASTEQKKGRIARYRDFVSNLITERNVLDKKFYVTVPATPIELGLMTADSVIPGRTEFDATKYEKSVILEKAEVVLEPKRDHLISQFARIGLYARQLNTQEIIRIFYTNYNPEATEGQEIADTTHYTTPLVRANLMRQAQQMAGQGQQASAQQTSTQQPPAQQTTEGFSAAQANINNQPGAAQAQDSGQANIPAENLDLSSEQRRSAEQDEKQKQTQASPSPEPTQAQTQDNAEQNKPKVAAPQKNTPVQSNMPGGKKSLSQTGARRQPSLTESEAEVGINQVGKTTSEKLGQTQNLNQAQAQQQNSRDGGDSLSGKAGAAGSPEARAAKKTRANKIPSPSGSFKIEESIDDFSYAPPKENSDPNSKTNSEANSGSQASGEQAESSSESSSSSNSGSNSQNQSLNKNSNEAESKHPKQQDKTAEPPSSDNQQNEINNLVKKVSVFQGGDKNSGGKNSSDEGGGKNGGESKSNQAGSEQQNKNTTDSDELLPIPEIK